MIISIYIRKRLHRLNRANLEEIIRAAQIGTHHYIVAFPIVAGELRTIDIFVHKGVVLRSSSAYLHRVYGKSFAKWLFFAHMMYEDKLQISVVE